MIPLKPISVQNFPQPAAFPSAGKSVKPDSTPAKAEKKAKVTEAELPEPPEAKG